jgi:CRP-like cAMP-binding protein
MAPYVAPINLQTALAQECEKVRKPKGTVLFQRGKESFGMFVVLSGKVCLDFGVDSPFTRTYSAGALLGLPATLTGRNYNMTATVTENAELGFWGRQQLNALLRKHPDYCRALLEILGERMSENQKIAKSLLMREEPTEQESYVV